MNRKKPASYSSKFLAVVVSALTLPLSTAWNAPACAENSAPPAVPSTPVPSTAAPATTTPSATAQPGSATPAAPKKKKLVFTPGVPLTITTNSENIRVTNDAKLAREQATTWPDSPEAHFVLAVALTRTSQVEEALKEIRIARKLSTQKGGAVYFDEMIAEYEKMLESYPEDNEVRYHLAWAYYMKAYVLARYSKGVVLPPPPAATTATAPAKAAGSKTSTDKSTTEKPTTTASVPPNSNPANASDPAEQVTPNVTPPGKWHEEWVKQSANMPVEEDTTGGDLDKEREKHLAEVAAQNGATSGSPSNAADSGTSTAASTSTAPAPQGVATSAASDKKAGTPESSNPLEKAIANLGPVTGMDYAMANAAPQVVPQIKSYYKRALNKLDEVLDKDPNDMWARLYRAHLRLEYTGDIESAMQVWESCREKNPNSPAPYFFLGEGYLKKGNLQQCLTNVSKAIALRAIGN